MAETVHIFTRGSRRYSVDANKLVRESGLGGVVLFYNQHERDLAAETLRLAEEVEAAAQNRRTAEKQIFSTAMERLDLLQENRRLKEEVETSRQADQMAREESAEIIGELSMALAVGAGEKLEPCGGGDCPGHLGPKARAKMREALDALDRTQNALADAVKDRDRARATASDTEMARLVLLAENRNLRSELRALREMASADIRHLKGQVAAQARTIDALGGWTAHHAAAVDKLSASLIEIPSRHCGERGTSEGAVETLERIITERDSIDRDAAALRTQVIQQAGANETIDALAAKSRRRKAKIRKLKELLRASEAGDFKIPLALARCAGEADGRRAERADVLAYLDAAAKQAEERGDVFFDGAAGALGLVIRAGRHLTAPASQPQEPSPEQRSAPE